MIGCACATLVWVLFVRPVEPQDLEVFLRAGRAVREGLTPYVNPTSPRVWSGHSFVYPYLTAWWFAPLSLLHARAAEMFYYLSSVAALIVTVRLIGDQRRGLAVVVLALASEPVVRAMQLGTINVWLLLGLALAWRYRERALVVIAALTAVIVAKLFLAPMVVWLLVTRRRRSAWQVAALSAVAIVLGCVLADLPVTGFIHMLSVLSAHEGPDSSSITSRLLQVGFGATAATGLSMSLAAVVIATTACWTRRTGDERVVFCGCVVGSLMLTPIVWSHYLVLLLVIPLLTRWGARAALGALAASWLVSTPSGVPALQALRAHQAVGIALDVTAVLVAAAAAAPWVRQRICEHHRTRPPGRAAGLSLPGPTALSETGVGS